MYRTSAEQVSKLIFCKAGKEKGEEKGNWLGNWRSGRERRLKGRDRVGRKGRKGWGYRRNEAESKGCGGIEDSQQYAPIFLVVSPGD